MSNAIAQILDLTKSASTFPTKTALANVTIIKGEVPEHQLAAIYEPMIGFTVQGRKTISIGDQVIDSRGPSYYVIPTDVPANAKVRPGPRGEPYLSIGLRIDRTLLLSLVESVEALPVDPSETREFGASRLPSDFLDAWLRLLRLSETPEHIPALAPLFEREILYRTLCGPHGWQLRQLCFENGNAQKIEQAVRSIRRNFAKPIDVKPMASEIGMAPTTFHRQFKQVTGMSPIQFQKQLRLLEARKLMVFDGLSVSQAAFEVGYESASQFNREYSRQFGVSPARDAVIVRQLEEERIG